MKNIIFAAALVILYLSLIFVIYSDKETNDIDKKAFLHKIDSLNQKTQILYEELYFEKQESAIIKLQRDSLCVILDVKSVHMPSLDDLKGAKRVP